MKRFRFLLLALMVLLAVGVAFAQPETQPGDTNIFVQLFGQNTVNLLFAVCLALLAISEVLAYIPSIKANSVFQAIVNGLKKVTNRP